MQFLTFDLLQKLGLIEEKMMKISKYILINKIFLIAAFCVAFSQNLYSQTNLPSSFPDRIILNLNDDNTLSVSVTWRTDSTVTEGICELHPMTGSKINAEIVKSYKATTTAVHYEYKGEPDVLANQHSLIMNQLEAGKKYLYRVGNQGNWSEWFEFGIQQNDENFSFVYFGDPQTDNRSQGTRVVRKAYEMVGNCSFILYGGDIINRGGRDVEWQEWFDAGSYIFASVPQVLTPGNHDYTDDGIVSDNPNIKPSIVYLVSVSEPKQYEAGNNNSMQKRGSHLQLFQQISIDGNELSYSAVSVDGKIFDQFKLKKKKDGSTKFIDQSEN